MFFFSNLFLSCPSFIFTTGGLKSLAAHLCMPFFSFFCITHCWLSNRLVSQSREGDSDLLLAQPQNNKITSLPACSGHGTSIDGDLAPQNCFFVKCCRTERMISPDRITKNKSTNSKQVTPHTLLLRHSRWPPQGCALIQVLPAEVRDGCRSLGVEVGRQGVEVWGREKKITTSFPPPPSLKSELCKAIRCPGWRPQGLCCGRSGGGERPPASSACVTRPPVRDLPLRALWKETHRRVCFPQKVGAWGAFLVASTSGSSLCTFGTTDFICLHTWNQRSLDGHVWMDGWTDRWMVGWTNRRMDGFDQDEGEAASGLVVFQGLSIWKQTVRSSQWRPAQWCKKIIIIIVVILLIIIVLSCSWEEVCLKHNRRSLSDAETVIKAFS